jgi:hypothetical protein
MLPNREGRLPCDAAATPALERLIFYDDSSYFGIRVARPRCQDRRVASSDTVYLEGQYQVHGDTLTLYSGGGDEIFESYNGRLFPDSVVQVSVDPIRIKRYTRRPGRQ